MLVKFNVNPSSAVTSYSARMANFCNCVLAIATASAGGTPVVYPYTTNITSATDNTKNCITSVLSNTEAGGWTQSTGSANQLTNNNATLATNLQYSVDLYTNTGKATYPYNKVTFGFSGAGSTIDGSQTAYGGIKHGFGITSTLTTLGWNSNSSFSSTTIWSDSTGGLNNPFYTSSSNAEDWEFLMAATSTYIIISGRNGIFYYGLRDQNYYEIANPGGSMHLGFGYANRSTYGTKSTGSGGSGGSWVLANIPYFNISTLVPNQVLWSAYNIVGASPTYTDAISGQVSSTSPSVGVLLLQSGSLTFNTGQAANSNSNPAGYAPLFLKGSDYTVSSSAVSEGPVQDAVTQAWTVPASSIIMRSYSNANGTYNLLITPVRLPGILKGAIISPAQWTYCGFTDYSEFTYNGETWVMVRTGTSNNTVFLDIFFIRKA